jgi:hypothetical protein
LITGPVGIGYQIEAPAVDEIIHVTGCHPFFTQLVCMELCAIHNDTRKGVMTLSDVHQAVNQALLSGGEQVASAWKDSDCTAEERLVLAALTSAENGQMTADQVGESISGAGYVAPTGLAVHQLCSRDVPDHRTCRRPRQRGESIYAECVRDRLVHVD